MRVGICLCHSVLDPPAAVLYIRNSPTGVHCQPSLWIALDGQVKTEFEIVSLVSPTAITVGPVCRDLL